MNVDALPPVLVVDASAGIKWVVNERESDVAIALLTGRTFLTSAVFWAEVGNALATKTRRGDIERSIAIDAFFELGRIPITAIDLTRETVLPALELSSELLHPVYDCCYLAIAMQRGAPVITADMRFARAVSRNPALAGYIITLADIRMV